MKFQIEFSTKNTDFVKKFVLTMKDEATAWNWAEKQKEAWKVAFNEARFKVDPRKIKVKIIEIPELLIKTAGS